MRFQQEQGQCLVEAQRRKAERREDLLRVAGASGIPRTYFGNPTRWNEVARESLSYEPERALVAMLRDVARTVRLRGTKAQQQNVRRAITLYIGRTLLNECLEPLGPQDEPGTVLELYQESVKEIGEAECATAQALQAPNPNNDERAARELEEAAVATNEAAKSLRARIEKALTGVRAW